MLNDHVRSTEAFAYIEEKLFGDSQNSLPSDETGETLKMIFETNSLFDFCFSINA